MEHYQLIDLLTLRSRPRPSAVSRFAAFFLTPMKNVIPTPWFGWEETEHTAYVRGRLVRPPVRSTDGNWLLDLRIEDLRLDELRFELQDARFIRVVAGKGRVAAEFCDNHRLGWNDVLEAFGPLFIDRSGPYLELHPYSYLRYVER